MIIRPPCTARHEGSGTRPRTRVLIKFRHGLGDAVQLTSVVRQLLLARPDWGIDVAALVGKDSAFRELCRSTLILEQDSLDDGVYDHTFDLQWPECVTCYPHVPSTKAQRCLHEVFGIQPRFDLCGYMLHVGEEEDELARRYLERDVGVTPADNGRYPIALIHYEGNTSAAKKNLPVSIARRICEEVLELGAIPVILDWDYRSPLPDGDRIFNPHVETELWRGRGTGDAAVLAALVDRAALFIGIDSGPLHVAAATRTPTIAVWTGHHPVHYLPPTENVTHLVPAAHATLLRGDREAGLGFFERHYHFETGTTPAEALPHLIRDRLQGVDASLFRTRSFWIRTDNASQDLVVVNDVLEKDSYRVAELPMPKPVVIDVGAHIGCFSAKLHRRNPLARIIAVECCPENVPVLTKNVGSFATVVQAAITYESDVALLNSVYPDCITTGASIVVRRDELMARLACGELPAKPAARLAGKHWADLRPLKTLTLEELADQHDFDEIDILKLDCEGSELSILRHTKMLLRIAMIVGEYHDRSQFMRLIDERMADWDLKFLTDGEQGTFWLTSRRLERSGTCAADCELILRTGRGETALPVTCATDECASS